DDTITQLEIAKARTDDDRRNLVGQQDAAQHTLDQLTRAQADANAAISAQNATLARATTQLTRTLVAQKQQKEAQARRAAGPARAAALAAATAKEDAAPSDLQGGGPAPRAVPPEQRGRETQPPAPPSAPPPVPAPSPPPA